MFELDVGGDVALGEVVVIVEVEEGGLEVDVDEIDATDVDKNDTCVAVLKDGAVSSFF